MAASELTVADEGREPAGHAAGESPYGNPAIARRRSERLHDRAISRMSDRMMSPSGDSAHARTGQSRRSSVDQRRRSLRLRPTMVILARPKGPGGTIGPSANARSGR